MRTCCIYGTVTECIIHHILHCVSAPCEHLLRFFVDANLKLCESTKAKKPKQPKIQTDRR